MVSMSASHVVGSGFVPDQVKPKTIIKIVQTASLLDTQVFGQGFGSAA